MASLNFDDVSRGTDNKKTKRTPHGATPVLFHSHGNHDAITIFIFVEGGVSYFHKNRKSLM